MGERRSEVTASRAASFRVVSQTLAGLPDRELRELVRPSAGPAESAASGMGGRCGVLDLDGTAVFVKRIPLTELETAPAHRFSTRNMFRLPAFYHYGMGSCGFGAWRELALHRSATQWVLDGACPAFPLLYRWAVVPDRPPEQFLDELGGVAGAVARWGGDDAVRTRLEALAASTSSVVLFLEHVPHTLDSWLRQTPDADLATILAGLREITSFLRGRGVAHLDTHFGNVLTDGDQLYLTDFGLALSRDFDLEPDEAACLAVHAWYDHHYVALHLLKHHEAAGRVRHLLEGETDTLLSLDLFHAELWRGNLRIALPDDLTVQP